MTDTTTRDLATLLAEGKVHTSLGSAERAAIRKVLEERDTLAAHVERLRGLLERAMKFPFPHPSSDESCTDGLAVRRDIVQALAATPEQSLEARDRGIAILNKLTRDIKKCVGMNSDNEQAYKWILDQLEKAQAIREGKG